MKQRESVKLQRCRLCPLVAKNELFLEFHVRTAHPDQPSYFRDPDFVDFTANLFSTTCDLCLRRFPHVADMALHAMTEHDRLHFCSFCGLMSDKPLAAASSGHMRSEYHEATGKGSYFGCPYCADYFHSKYAARKHIADSHSPDVVAACYCRRCDTYFPREDVRKKHEELAHAPPKNLTPPVVVDLNTSTDLDVTTGRDEIDPAPDDPGPKIEKTSNDHQYAPGAISNHSNLHSSKGSAKRKRNQSEMSSDGPLSMLSSAHDENSSSDDDEDIGVAAAGPSFLIPGPGPSTSGKPKKPGMKAPVVDVRRSRPMLLGREGAKIAANAGLPRAQSSSNIPSGVATDTVMVKPPATTASRGRKTSGSVGGPPRQKAGPNSRSSSVGPAGSAGIVVPGAPPPLPPPSQGVFIGMLGINLDSYFTSTGTPRRRDAPMVKKRKKRRYTCTLCGYARNSERARLQEHVRAEHSVFDEEAMQHVVTWHTVYVAARTGGGLTKAKANKKRDFGCQTAGPPGCPTCATTNAETDHLTARLTRIRELVEEARTA